MGLAELGRVLDAVEATGCPFWLEGGWGVDALVGRQTRDHGDVDIDIDSDDEAQILRALAGIGYVESVDERPTRIELLAPDGSCVDLHPLQLDGSGAGRQIAPDGSVWVFAAEWFAVGSLHGRPVPCFSVDAQRHFHTGYELRDIDRADLAVLDRLQE